MIGLVILGVMLTAGAYKLLRAVYFLHKAKRLNARSAELEAETAAIRARLAEGEASDAAEKAEKKAAEAAAAVALGFVAEEDLDTRNAQPVDPAATAAVAAVTAGDWETGAEYVEAAGRDWEQRWQRVRALSEAAAEDDVWLAAWQAARPADPTAALVHADTAVAVAWNVRGSQAGSRTTQEQFRLFRELLLTAREAAHEAQRLADPADPVPYIVEQPIGHGLGYPNDDYRALWAEVVARDPKNLVAHTTAQQYWSQKWRGSHELAMAFAREAAAGGAPGELLSVLPLIALVEQESWDEDLDPAVFYAQPAAAAAVDAALADLAAADPADRRAIRLRHLLAWLLWWQDRDAEAVEQFRHVDGYIGAMPWTYAGSPKGRYLHARNWAVRVTAAGS